MEYIDSMKWRYATKKFDRNKKVASTVLKRILQAANLAPTSLGFQPIKILNIESPFLRDRIKSASFNQNQVTDASNLLILCVDADFSEENVSRYINTIAQARNISATELNGFESMVNGWLGGLPNDEERLNWATKQAYITIGTMMTACALEKVDSCPMEGFVPDQVAEILELQKLNLFPVLMLPVGYRDEDDLNQHLTKVRKSMNDYVINF
jgi:nitroreductase